ncbi:MAG: UDP-glucose/GDP-mannose dehydrogenase family protein, partial [Planctomycetaceae bacterium]
MRIVVLGTGYVGLVTGTCLADSGNEVACVDIDEAKIARLNRGEIPIYEPGLDGLVVQNVRAGRLKFTSDAASVVSTARVIFVAVGTPQDETGAADLTGLWKAIDGLAPLISDNGIVVIKSTVPVGTNRAAARRLRELTGRDIDVASNPE